MSANSQEPTSGIKFIASIARLSPLKAWRDDDPDLDAMINAARNTVIARKIERIDEAGERGDWKADSWYLERAPETREAFGGSNAQGFDGNIVHINVPDPKPVTVPVIDATPVSAR